MSYPPPYPPGAPPSWPQPHGSGPGRPAPFWGPVGSWGAPPPVPPPGRRWTRRTVVLVTGGAVLAAGLVVLVVLAGLHIGRSQASSLAAVVPSVVPSTSAPSDPGGLGDDAGLDAYAQQCHDGQLSACDDLLGLSPSGSAYEQYGMTCGGRVKAFDVYTCTDLGGVEPTSPPSTAPVGDDPGLDGYAQRCHDGLLSACDDLYALSPPMSEYERYGMTCGGRVPAMDVTSCEDLAGD